MSFWLRDVENRSLKSAIGKRRIADLDQKLEEPIRKLMIGEMWEFVVLERNAARKENTKCCFAAYLKRNFISKIATAITSVTPLAKINGQACSKIP